MESPGHLGVKVFTLHTTTLGRRYVKEIHIITVGREPGKIEIHDSFGHLEVLSH
jgi:hypothetical protein